MNMEQVRNGLKQALGFALSFLLVLADWLGRFFTGAWRWIAPLLPTTGRLAAAGALTGGVVVGGGYVVVRYGTLITEPVSWARVGFVWGVALIAWAIAALMYMLLKTSATMLAAILYRLTDIGNRPIVFPEQRRSTLDDSGGMGGALGAAGLKPSPNFRDPGGLSEASSFVPYDEENGYMREVLAEMRGRGIDEKDIGDMLKEYEQQKKTTA